jgi:peroxiredoxin
MRLSGPAPRLLALAAAAALCVAARAGDEPNIDKLGKKIDDFALTDADAKPVSLYGLKDKKAVVVVFTSFECPVAKGYAPALAEMHKTYSEKGVAFLAVDASDDGDDAWVAKQAAEFKIPFPVLKDDRRAAADALRAVATPEAFVLDHNFVLRYRGRIDDGYAARLKKNDRVTRHDLREALDEVLAGKDVSTPATKAVGCPLPSADAVKATGAVTFHRDVEPILQNNCQQCHRPGEVGPFPLMTYRQAAGWAADIKEYTQGRKMPPWKPVENVPFHNERKLSDKEIETLAAWADGGATEGDPKDAPKPREFADGWQLGQPDLVLTVPEEMTVGAGGRDLFRCFVLPTDLDEDKYVVAFEVKPGNNAVVHHALNFVDRTGKGRKLEQAERDRAKADDEPDRGPGYNSTMGVGFLPQGVLGGWAPGQMAHPLPDGHGWLLPKGSDVVVQVHYHRTGRVEKDHLSLGLYFAKKPGTKPFKGLILPGLFLAIPADNDQFKVHGDIEVYQDCVLHDVMPHMHKLGKEIKVTITPPDCPPTTLIAIQDWDYNWQETYFLKEPMALKKGTRLSVDAVYDNSAKNPMNPFDPPRWVLPGEQTTNEMCFVFMGATSDAPGRIPFGPPGGKPSSRPREPDKDKPEEEKKP